MAQTDPAAQGGGGSKRRGGRASFRILVVILQIGAGIFLLNKVAGPAGSSTPTTSSTVSSRSTTTTTSTTLATAVNSTTTTLAPTTTTTRVTTTLAPTTTTTPSKLYSSITVRVANATQVSGLAGRVTTFIQGLGFNVVAPVNANVSQSTSTIYYYTGFSAAAGALAADLSLPSSDVKPDPATLPVSAPPEDINVIAGNDLGSIG